MSNPVWVSCAHIKTPPFKRSFNMCLSHQIQQYFLSREPCVSGRRSERTEEWNGHAADSAGSYSYGAGNDIGVQINVHRI